MMYKLKYMVAIVLFVSIAGGVLEPYSRPSPFTFGVPEGFEVIKDTSEKVIMINDREIIQIGFNKSFEYDGKVYPRNCIMVDGQEVLVYGNKDIYVINWTCANTNISVLAKMNDSKYLYDFLESFNFNP